MAENGTFTMWRGSDVTLGFTSKPNDPTPPSAVIVWTLAASLGGAVLIRRTATVASPTDLRVTLAASDTASLHEGNYFWDAWDQDPGATIPIAYGTLTLLREVAPYP